MANSKLDKPTILSLLEKTIQDHCLMVYIYAPITAKAPPTGGCAGKENTVTARTTQRVLGKKRTTPRCFLLSASNTAKVREEGTTFNIVELGKICNEAGSWSQDSIAYLLRHSKI